MNRSAERIGVHSRLTHLWASVALAALVGASCGQFPGSHRDVLEFDPSTVASQAPPASPGPGSLNNGENSGPQPALRHTIVVVKRIKVFKRGNGPLYLCPVRGQGFFSDDFGAPRYAGGFHLHQGNDMFAPLGTPIVAPFDGVAVADPNELGGLAVKVFGTQGFVYNAHLVAYGHLGRVKAGTEIGYVGNTGDALGGPPHDHFEWHPGSARAIDPYPFLKEVCV